MPPNLALLSTLIGSNYPCLKLIFMVPKAFEPSKFDCICTTVLAYSSIYKALSVYGPFSHDVNQCTNPDNRSIVKASTIPDGCIY